MSIADKYAILESQIDTRKELPEPAIEPLWLQVLREFRLAQKLRRRYDGLSKKERVKR